MQETRVQSLVWEDPICRGATKPMHHNCWDCAIELGGHNYRAYEPQLLEPAFPRAHDLRQEKPPQWEACRPQQRAAPAHHNSRKACTARRIQHSQNKQIKKKKKILRKSNTMQYLSFSVWLTSLNIISSRFIHIVANGRISFIIGLNYIPLCVCVCVCVCDIFLIHSLKDT